MLSPELFTPDNIATFLTLTFLEIVLAGDNLVLIAILASKLPERQRPLARRIGLFAAVGTRILLLFSLFWLSHLETKLPIPLPGGDAFTVTPRQIVFSIGGAFLIWKALSELFTTFLGDGTQVGARLRPVRDTFLWVIVQIAFFDIIFSLDSVIAAIGIAQHVEIMVAAVLAATLVMLFLVNPISEFIERHQIVKVAALDLLVVIGIFLIAEAFHQPLPRVELYTGLLVVLAFQAIVLWVFALRPAMRLLLVIATMAVLAGGAFVLMGNEALAGDLHARVIAAWQSTANLIKQAIEAIRTMLARA